jgi:NitT/TauT family transport system ATP-binding protein
MPDLEPLPSTGISKILTLCEVLADHAGGEDLYRLTHDLHMPFAEALLVVKSAEMLDLADTPGSDVVLTPLGQKVHEGSLGEKKALLRPQMMRLRTFQHITRLLKNADAGGVPAEVIVEELAVRLPQEQPRQLFTTLLNWGRYCEIFNFAHDTNLFSLHEH